jgi:hypothetical protein
MAIKIQVVLDCVDPARLSAFWAEALGYQLQPAPSGYDSWPAFLAASGIPESDWNSASAVVDPAEVGPRIYFQRVPEPRIGKNRVHLDLNVSGGAKVPADERKRRIADEVARLTALGATDPHEFDQRGEYWIVLHDPEGNEFCVQ